MHHFCSTIFVRDAVLILRGRVCVRELSELHYDSFVCYLRLLAPLSIVVPYSDSLVADLLEQIIEVALFLDFADLFEQFFVQTQFLFRHLFASSAAIGTLFLECGVLRGRFGHELVSVLPALVNFLLLALPPLLVLRNRVLHLLSVESGRIFHELQVLLLL